MDWRPKLASEACLVCPGCDNDIAALVREIELDEAREKAERAAEPSPLRGPEWPHLEVR